MTPSPDITLYGLQWVALMAVFALALISPGPDFVMAVRNAIIYNRRAGFMTALGFAAGVLVHVSYTLMGIAAVIAQSILLFTIIKFAGAAYLIWIGFQALRSRGASEAVIQHSLEQKESGAQKHISHMHAFRTGFLTNLLNPKATLFFLAVFSQVINPVTPLGWQALYGLSCAVMTALWFSAVTMVLTQKHMRALFLRATKTIDRLCGVVMIALGIKVALTAR